MFVDSDDEVFQEGNRGETEWIEYINNKLNKEGTAAGFKMHSMKKMEQEAEENKGKTEEELK